MKPRICITEKEYCKAENIFESSTEFECIAAPSDEDFLAETITKKSAEAAVLGVEGYVDQLYSALPRGGIIARFGVGHDGVDKSKATKAGIIVTNTPGALDDSVAEHAIWLIGSIARNIASHDADMRAGKWPSAAGVEVRGKTLLILGCGRIGCRVGRIASFGLRMNVMGFDIAQLDEEELRDEWGIQQMVSSIDDAIATADFVSIHLAASEATRHFVDVEFLSKMKSGSFLVNTARGSIVDETALYDAVLSGRIAGAGLDVLGTEPYVPVDPKKDLRKLKQVLLTPHVASSTVEASARIAQGVLKNIKACSEKNYGQLDIVNPEVLKNL